MLGTQLPWKHVDDGSQYLPRQSEVISMGSVSGVCGMKLSSRRSHTQLGLGGFTCCWHVSALVPPTPVTTRISTSADSSLFGTATMVPMVVLSVHWVVVVVNAALSTDLGSPTTRPVLGVEAVQLIVPSVVTETVISVGSRQASVPHTIHAAPRSGPTAPATRRPLARIPA
jgi:hypothetical protein